MKKSVRVIIRGKVQGVYFRAYTQQKAIELNLTGWVKNNPDQTVEALFYGNADNVDEMVKWCYVGSPYSKVEKVDSYPQKEEPSLTTFSIAY